MSKQLYRLEDECLVTREMAIDAGEPEREGTVYAQMYVPDEQGTDDAAHWRELIAEHGAAFWEYVSSLMLRDGKKPSDYKPANVTRTIADILAAEEAHDG